MWLLAPAYRSRLRANWLLLGLALALHVPPGSPHWLQDVATALTEIVAVRLAALIIFRLILHRAGWPVILTDVAIVAGYGVVLITLLVHEGVNVSGLLATSALLAGILGLAMQEVLGNLIGGVALHADGAIEEGVWIKSEHGTGRVTHVRLRHTCIETADNNRIIIPNSSLTKSPLTIVADVQRVSVRFSMSATHRPATVMRVVEEALQSSSLPDIARQPPPCCCISAFETQHIEYLVFMWVTAPGREPETVSAAFKRIYYALERAGAPVASVPTGLEISRAIKGTPARTPEEAVDMIRKIPIWSTLTENEMQTLAARLRCVVFGPGEPIVKEGETGASMFVLLRGRVTVTIGTSSGQEQIAMLDAGGFFGEMSLMTGERRSATVTAFDEVECVELHKDDVADLLQQRPELAHDISSVLENRQRELTSARAKFENAVQGPRSGALMARIQQFFGIDRKSAGAIAPQH